MVDGRGVVRLCTAWYEKEKGRRAVHGKAVLVDVEDLAEWVSMPRSSAETRFLHRFRFAHRELETWAQTCKIERKSQTRHTPKQLRRARFGLYQ